MKGLATRLCQATFCYVLAGDHTSVIVILHSQIAITETRVTLYNIHTKWKQLRETLSQDISLKLPLKTPEQIEGAVKELTKRI